MHHPPVSNKVIQDCDVAKGQTNTQSYPGTGPTDIHAQKHQEASENKQTSGSVPSSQATVKYSFGGD